MSNEDTAVKAAAEFEFEEIELEVNNANGNYMATFTGTLLANVAELSVYLTDDERLVLYDEALTDCQVFEDYERLEHSIAILFGDSRGLGPYQRADYLELLNKIGIKPKMEI